MKSVQQALRNTLLYWPALVLLYLGNVFSALLLVVLPALNLLGPAHFTAIRDAADGIDAWAIMDELMPLADQMRQNSPLHVTDSTATALLLVGLVLFAAPLAAWPVSALLSGGLLLTYAEAPAPFSLKRFLWGCRHWWGTFLWLGLFQHLLTLVVLGVILGIGYLLMADIGARTLGVTGPLAVVLAVLIYVSFELARFLTIKMQTHNIFKVLWQALRYICKHPLQVLGLYGLGFGLVLIIHLIYRVALLPNLPLALWLLVLLVQQSFIFLRLWARAFRWSWGMAIINQMPGNEQ